MCVCVCVSVCLLACLQCPPFSTYLFGFADFSVSIANAVVLQTECRLSVSQYLEVEVNLIGKASGNRVINVDRIYFIIGEGGQTHI